MKIKYVCQVGPGASMPGGMLTVINSYISSPFLEEFEQKKIITVEKRYKLWTFIRGLTEILSLSVKNQVQILHLHMSERGSCIRASIIIFLFSTFGYPIVVHSHGSELETYVNGLSSFKKMFFVRMMKRANKIIVLTEGWKDFWSNIVDITEISVIPNWVSNPEIISKKYMSNGILNILFLGYIGDRKGTFDLIRAIKIVKEQSIKVHLNIAGNGELIKAKELVKSLELQEEISISGWANTKKKDELFRESDILVLPSHFESFGIVLLEAMINKLPVICSDSGFSHEIITDGIDGFVSKVSDFDDLAKKIMTLCNKDLLKKMGYAAQMKAKNQYTEEVVMNKVSRLYCRLIG